MRMYQMSPIFHDFIAFLEDHVQEVECDHYRKTDDNPEMYMDLFSPYQRPSLSVQYPRLHFSYRKLWESKPVSLGVHSHQIDFIGSNPVVPVHLLQIASFVEPHPAAILW